MKRRIISFLAAFALLALAPTTDARTSPKTSKKTKAKAFLQTELPLSLVLTTPVEIVEQGTEPVPLQGRQAITAVFSRPVIALGSDFGLPAAQLKLPFRLSCDVPGKFRWATTTIARFDPDVDWPTDLDCELVWVPDLTSYDGARLQLGGAPATRRFSSNPLTISSVDVLSDKAVNVTDDMWSASIGGGAPEVPPDGRIVVSFSYPVHLLTLKSSLKLLQGADGNGPSVDIDVRPCQSPAPWLYLEGWSGVTSSRSPPTPSLSLDVNTTCAEVVPKSQLRAGTPYVLRLPQGSRYHALAGPLQKTLETSVTGLRPFTIPFEPSTVYDTSYRRLDLWLQHGLSADTTSQALAKQISLCELQGAACQSVPFSLSLVARGKARLSVPTLQPDTQYRISIAANSAVKDGFGQGLQASSLAFWTSIIGYSIAPPVTRSFVAVLEAGADTTVSWPFVTRNPAVSPRNAHLGSGEAVASSAEAWELDLADSGVQRRVAQLVLQGYSYETNLRSIFGSPIVRVDVPEVLLTRKASRDAQWTQLLLPLRDSTAGAAPFRARLISTCCSRSGGSMNAKLLVNTSLSFSVIKSGPNFTAWVLDSQANGAPLAGAAVSLYLKDYMQQADPMLLATCTTDVDGLCTLTTVGMQGLSGAVMAFAVAGGQVAVLDSAGFISAPPAPTPFVGSLVADRRVVVPGDSLKITGFVQAVSAAGLTLPPSSHASLIIYPGWDSSPGGGSSGGILAPGATARPGRGLMGAGRDAAATATGTAAAAALTAATEPVVVGVDATVMVASDSVSGASVAVQPGKIVEGVAVVGTTLPFLPGSQAAPFSQVNVKLDGSTGMLHGEIPVPKSARLQTYTVQLSVPGLGDAGGDLSGPDPGPLAATSWPRPQGALFSFTVADPRPPTAELKLETTPWVLPTGVVVANVTAVSYIGASVAGSAMTLTWRTSQASGVVQLVTDSAGAASTAIDLGALPQANRSDLYDSVTINVEWVGPTRERITKDATVTIADGPARLDVELSLFTSLPGTAFAVAATLTSNTDGSKLSGLPGTATLRPAPNDSTAGIMCSAPAASCTLTSGAPMTASTCQLSLPCVGRFELEVCAEVAAAGAASPARVCTRQTLGRNASEWAQQPLSSHVEPLLFVDKDSYDLGDSVTLAFQNPWAGARLLVHWGNANTTKSKVINTVASGALARVVIGPLGDECLGGCSVLGVLSVPRQAAGQFPALPPADQLLVSRLFDPRAPHTKTLARVLDVRPDNKLGVTVEVASAQEEEDKEGPGAGAGSILDADGKEVLAIEPGSEAQITVSVKSGTQAGAAAPPAGSVEITVYAVDKAFLDLLPYDLPQPDQEMLLRTAADLSAYGMEWNRIAPGAVQAVYQKLMDRLITQDPWLPVDSSVFSSGVPAGVDVSDAEYLSRYASPLTYVPPHRNFAYAIDQGPMAAEAAMDATTTSLAAGAAEALSALPSASASAQRGKGPTSSSSSSASSSPVLAVRREGDFVVTPLFATSTTGPDGRARVTFTAPQNLGTFVIRAFASAGSVAKYGSGEAKVAVRRRVSLTPSVPRFVRAGDSFEAGVVVTVGSGPATVTLSLEIGDEADSPLTLVGTTTSKVVSFTAGGDLQKEIRFSFVAASLGTARLTFTASDGQQGGARDSLQLDIPVLGQQGDVWVATSFALTAVPPSNSSSGSSSSGGAQWQEGIDLPAAVPGSGGLTLTAGVGYFPSISALYDNLQQEQKDTIYALAPNALLWATLPAVLSYYAQPTSGEQDNLVAQAFLDLAKLTSVRPAVGLQWSDPTRWGSWLPTRADLPLNTWALFLASQHSTAALQAPSSASPWAILSSDHLPVWRSAVERQLVADAVESRSRPVNPGPYSDWHTLAWARLVLGADWVPNADGTSDQIRDDLSLSALLANSAKLSRETRVVVALLLLPLGSGAPPGGPQLVQGVVAELTSALRVQGRTAYLAAGPGSASASPLGDQALGLLLLLRSGAAPPAPLLPKLAAYVANPVPPGAAYGPFTPRPSWTDQGLAVAALTEYDRTRGSSKPRVELTAEANGLVVLEASFKTGSGSLAPVTNTTAWEDIPAAAQGSTSELNFEVTGTGEVSVAASLHFVPAALLSFPTYRGLFVESALQLVDPATGRPAGQRLAAVPLGSVVALTVQLTSPDDLGAVTLEVMMPGGLEPLDPNVAQGVGTGCDAGWVDAAAWGSFFRWWWWPVCPAQETRPSLVTFSYLALRAGTSTVTIRAVAATAGTFVVPPIRASADAQPELMGMSAAGKITVCADCAGPTYGTAPLPPNACPNGCSGNGVCNLKTGRCTCDVGFTRSDCSRPVA